MTQLKKIQSYCVQLARAMAAILEVEVVMIDEKLRIIAGTGIYGNKIDTRFDKNTVSYQVLSTGRTLVIPNA